MRSTIMLGAAAAIALIATDPALCMQASQPVPPSDSTQTPTPPTDPSQPTDPLNPAPVPDPAAPPQPAPQPIPPEMPAPQAPASPTAPQPPTMQGSTDSPVGPMATSPDSGATSAQSGGTTSAMRQPVASTKEYPPCTKTLQDNCRNPGEGPRRTARRPR